VWPENLFTEDRLADTLETKWWVLHTKPRAEKSLARRLFADEVSFFLPLREQTHQYRGRSKSSYLPVFPSYLFLFGGEEDRLTARMTNLVVHAIKVDDQELLAADLDRVHRLIESGLPLSTVDQLVPGSEVEITAGPLVGMRGTVVRRGGFSKVIIEVHMLQQGISVEVDETMIQPIWHG
jgi:transcriptional antiterminator RfaH